MTEKCLGGIFSLYGIRDRQVADAFATWKIRSEYLPDVFFLNTLARSPDQDRLLRNKSILFSLRETIPECESGEASANIIASDRST